MNSTMLLAKSASACLRMGGTIACLPVRAVRFVPSHHSVPRKTFHLQAKLLYFFVSCREPPPRLGVSEVLWASVNVRLSEILEVDLAASADLHRLTDVCLQQNLVCPLLSSL